LHVLEDLTSPALPLLDTARAWHLALPPIAPPGLDAGRRAPELLLGLDHWLRRLPSPSRCSAARPGRRLLIMRRG
jgi:hypothetical protein